MKQLTDPVTVDLEVLDGIMIVKDSQEVDMFNYVEVMTTARCMGFYKTYDWMKDNQGLYSQGLFTGFRCDPVEGITPLN